jgi:hypothetical protein
VASTVTSQIIIVSDGKDGAGSAENWPALNAVAVLAESHCGPWDTSIEIFRAAA